MVVNGYVSASTPNPIANLADTKDFGLRKSGVDRPSGGADPLRPLADVGKTKNPED
jgi:hypothetical protein